MRKYTVEFAKVSEIEAEGLGDAFDKAAKIVRADPEMVGFKITRSVDEDGENTIWSDVSFQRDMEPAPKVDLEHFVVEDFRPGD